MMADKDREKKFGASESGGAALIAVDVQNDFCLGGALEVPMGDEVVAPINKLIYSGLFDVIIFTKDRHPANHCSFIENGGTWPKHCVKGTVGAELRPSLDYTGGIIVEKGGNAGTEAYSGFCGTGLAEVLRARGIGRVFVCGLATDHCVKATALDAKRLGFDTTIVIDACRGMDAAGVGRTVTELKRQGVKIALFDVVLAEGSGRNV